MDVLPDVMIGYKLPTEGIRRAPHPLQSAGELQVAMETLKGMIRRSRGAKKILQIMTVESDGVTQPSVTTGRITTHLASRKEVLDGLESVPEEKRSTFAELWTKLGCVVPGHNKCVIDNKAQPAVHKPVSIQDVSYWANQITQGRATLTVPPNDIRWDHEKSVPHVSSASAGSSATKVQPLFTVRQGTSVISIPSDSSTATLLLEQHDVKPSLKRPYSFSPDPSMSAGHSRSKCRFDEPTRPHLVVCEGVHYPTVTNVLVALNKVFPLHSYLTYDDMMPQHQIYYAPDVATMSVDWYVENMGMGRSSAVHLRDYAALMTARVCHETNY
ncbi:hypothetical protein RhiJN_17216 [Ceratobasidium sp. AG-Ba]|nr:hypothetical protein RhiJN_17216 [Ceratobasidium sp. AG-Ba]